MHRPQLSVLSVVCCAIVSSVPGLKSVQPADRRVATVEALLTTPIFFHGETVIVHADVTAEGVLTYLFEEDSRLLTVDIPPPLRGNIEQLEVIGTFYDIGRLEPTDPRISTFPFERLSTALFSKPWPAVGELPVLVASSSRVVTENHVGSLRTVALHPGVYLDESIAVTGRFRGRNLYGDLPRSPRESRWDFVLASADAALWVVGRQPKGDHFDLDVQARLDTGRWLKVTGKVRLHSGMVVIDATDIALAEPVDEPPRLLTTREARRGPPPEVIFSTPLPEDTDVVADTMVRIQFSRDMDPDSFEDHVAAFYADGPGVNLDASAGLEVRFEVAYRARNRVLEIRFNDELQRFRKVDVRLLEGITATDGVSLETWTLSFFVGG